MAHLVTGYWNSVTGRERSKYSPATPATGRLESKYAGCGAGRTYREFAACAGEFQTTRARTGRQGQRAGRPGKRLGTADGARRTDRIAFGTLRRHCAQPRIRDRA